jgi:dipeptidase E
MQKLLLASTSKLYGQLYLEYLVDSLPDFFGKNTTVTFIPFARPGGISHDEYTNIARKGLAQAGIKVKGVHEGNVAENIRNAEAFFTGGGNTFVLTKTLHDSGWMSLLRDKVKQGTPYMGSSAGTNLAGMTVGTTNDMPIVHPPSFEALNLIPFNINPHYLDPQPDSKHMGETRETRIQEFHCFNTQPVLGLREGSWLRVDGDRVSLEGEITARLFRAGQDPVELSPGIINV